MSTCTTTPQIISFKAGSNKITTIDDTIPKNLMYQYSLKANTTFTNENKYGLQKFNVLTSGDTFDWVNLHINDDNSMWFYSQPDSASKIIINTNYMQLTAEDQLTTKPLAPGSANFIGKNLLLDLTNDIQAIPHNINALGVKLNLNVANERSVSTTANKIISFTVPDHTYLFDKMGDYFVQGLYSGSEVSHTSKDGVMKIEMYNNGAQRTIKQTLPSKDWMKLELTDGPVDIIMSSGNNYYTTLNQTNPVGL